MKLTLLLRSEGESRAAILSGRTPVVRAREGRTPNFVKKTSGPIILAVFDDIRLLENIRSYKTLSFRPAILSVPFAHSHAAREAATRVFARAE